MKFCQHCGKELVDEAVVCPGCGCAVTAKPTPVIALADDEVNVGLCVLSALIPLFGVIYWPLKHNETPKRAKACGVTALISWGVSMFIGAIAYGVGLSILLS